MTSPSTRSPPGRPPRRCSSTERRRPPIDALANMSPLERLGTPEDVAEFVAFLAGPARWINGQVLYSNGGII